MRQSLLRLPFGRAIEEEYWSGGEELRRAKKSSEEQRRAEQRRVVTGQVDQIVIFSISGLMDLEAIS